MAHNPDTILAVKAVAHIVVDYDHCSYCGACVAVCPPDSIVLRDAILLIDAATCTVCERCIPVCPTGALTLKETAGGSGV